MLRIETPDAIPCSVSGLNSPNTLPKCVDNYIKYISIYEYGAKMSLIKWREEFCINITAIDIQHKTLVDIINRYHTSLSLKKDKEVMGGILEELIDYTHYHFRDEEKIMRDMEYSGFDDHRRKHNDLEAGALEYYRKFKDDEIIDPNEFMNFLKDWLVNHMLTEDRKVGDAWRKKTNTCAII